MPASLSKVYSTRTVWYCGDFHAHTTCSDGAYSPRELNSLAAELGMDFLSITDHNTVAAFDDFDDNVMHMVLAGIEISSLDGHFVVLGFNGNAAAEQFFHDIMDPPLDVRVRQHLTHEKIADLVGRIKEAGFLIDLAHPFLWPWEWRDHDLDIADLTCIELINDPTYRPNPAANPATRHMWEAWLNAGYRITAVGGTDFHRPHPGDDPVDRTCRLNVPLTYVYARELSGQAILEGVCQHHVYVTMGPRIEFQAESDGKNYMIGDDLGITTSTVYLTARMSDCMSPAEGILVMNGKTIIKVPVRDGKIEIEMEIHPKETITNGWVRFDVIGHDEQMVAVSNPIYFGRQEQEKSSPYGRFIGGYVKV
jgi:hypothetical protein